MDALAALALQIDWGADEALAALPVDRRSGLAPAAVTIPLPAMSALARARALAAAAADIANLRAALADFDGCGLRATATNLVFAQGDPDCGLVLIADVPGPDEDRSGVPFAGPGGAFLDRMLGSIGVDRARVYTTSMLPWRPPGDRKPAVAEIELCLPFLHRHLQLLRPKAVMLLGALAGRTLMPDHHRKRGEWGRLAIPGADAVPALALVSPAAISTTPQAKQDAWTALLRLRRALDVASLTIS